MLSNFHDTDQELFARIQARDKQAFDVLYHRYFEKLYISAYKRLRDQNICKDIVHDVFLDLWQRASAIENSNVEAYLHTAIRYQVFKKAAKAKQSYFYSLFDKMGAWLEKGNLKEDIPYEMRYKEALQLVELWIDTLPVKRKTIFLLHYREQLNSRQIAERLHLSQKTVQNQLGLAFSDLKGKLSGLAVICIVSLIL